MPTKFSLKDGLMILLITLLGYGAAFSYETGYANYFSIDYEFIQIDPKSIFTGTSCVSCIFLSTIAFISISGEKETKIYDKLAKLFIFTAITLLFTLPYGKREFYSHYERLIVLAIFSVILLILIHYTNTSKGIWKQLLLAGLSFVIIISFSNAMGVLYASGQHTFSTFNIGNKSYAIIKIYSGNIYAIRVDGVKLSDTESIFIPAKNLNTIEIKKITINNPMNQLTYHNITSPKF